MKGNEAGSARLHTSATPPLQHIPPSVPPQRLPFPKKKEKKKLPPIPSSNSFLPPIRKLLRCLSPTQATQNAFPIPLRHLRLDPWSWHARALMPHGPLKSRRMPDLNTMDIDVQRRLRPSLRRRGFCFHFATEADLG